MEIVIKRVCPEHVAQLLDAIRQHRIPGGIQPSNWYEGIEVHPDKEEK